MKKLSELVAFIVLPVALASCAGTQSLTQAQGDCAYVDCAKVTAIDRVAKQRGVNVIWVNPPQKRDHGHASAD